LGHTYSQLGNLACAAEYTQRALTAATRCRDTATMGKAHYALAWERLLSGSLRRGLLHGRQAVSLLGRAGEPWWLGMAHWIVGTTSALLSAFAAALQATAQAQALGAALADPRVQSSAACTTGWVEALCGKGLA